MSYASKFEYRWCKASHLPVKWHIVSLLQYDVFFPQWWNSYLDWLRWYCSMASLIIRSFIFRFQFMGFFEKQNSPSLTYEIHSRINITNHRWTWFDGREHAANAWQEQQRQIHWVFMQNLWISLWKRFFLCPPLFFATNSKSHVFKYE